MKKYALLTIGFKPPTPEVMEQWMAWFQSIGDKMVNQVGFMNGKEVTQDGTQDLPMDLDAITGCVTIEAESMEETLKIAQDCPMVSSTKVFEIRNH